MIVYMSINDNIRNEKIKKEIEEVIDKYEERKLMIIVDFNGHIGYIGSQSVNTNGKLVLDILEKNNLVLINGDDRCQGITTWEQRNFKSTIDFVICNRSGALYFCIC